MVVFLDLCLCRLLLDLLVLLPEEIVIDILMVTILLAQIRF